MDAGENREERFDSVEDDVDVVTAVVVVVVAVAVASLWSGNNGKKLGSILFNL